MPFRPLTWVSFLRRGKTRSYTAPMQIDPVAEWQRLTEFYREKSDEALEELAEDFGNLTETAQQVLTTELRSRGLSLPGSNPQPPSYQVQAPRDRRFARSADPLAFGSDMSDDQIDLENDGNVTQSEEEVHHEYTWKTLLCECNDRLEAWQLTQALKRAGIESWIEGAELGVSYPRVLVAADQLEDARTIADQPIPQAVLDELKELDTQPEEYELPTCPQCHAEDPVLESADPSNNWLCEACDARWSEPVPESGSAPARSAK